MSRWKKYFEKLKADPEKYAEYLAKRKQNSKNYHKRLEEDPEKLSKYKEARKKGVESTGQSRRKITK